MSKQLTLNSQDSQKITIDSEAANKSVLLKGLINDFGDDSEIPIPEVKGDILKKVVEYLEHYKSTEPKEIPKPLPSNNLADVTEEWDIKNFLDTVDLDTVFDLINAANYLDIKPLLDLTCAKIASLMKGKTAEDIRSMFNIENDLTEEELKEYEEYQI